MGAELDSVTYAYNNANWGDLLTSYGGKAITYDAIGNPLTYDGWSFTWEQGRQLAAMTKGSTTWTYTYDVNGLRTRRTNGTTTYKYTYHGSQLTHMTRGNDSLHFYYDASGRPFSVVYGGATYFYVTNLQGDVVAILNANGVQVVGYTYNAWGNVLTTTGSLASTLGAINPIRYRGYVYDAETGLYYLQSRYYNPEWGRFLNADSQMNAKDGVLGVNLFAYSGNNPVNKYDPSGHSAVLIALAIGAVLGGIYGGISAAANDQNVVEGILIGAVVGGLTGMITEVACFPLMLVGTFFVGAGGDIASQMILDDKSFGEVNLLSAGKVGATNAGLAIVGKGLSLVDQLAGLKGAEKIIFGAMTNSPLLGLGMAISMGIAENTDVYTVNDFLSDLLGEEYTLSWGD